MAAEWLEGRLTCFASLGVAAGLGSWTSYFPDSSEKTNWSPTNLEEMVEAIVEAGFDEVIPWIDGAPGTVTPADGPAETKDTGDNLSGYVQRIKEFVRLAHQRDVRVILYFAVGGSAGIRKDEHGRTFLFLDAIGAGHPYAFTVDRSGLNSLEAVRKGTASHGLISLAYPEVRSALIEYYVRMMKETGADGIQLEPISRPKDQHGVCVYGYEEPVVRAFKEEHGVDPHSLPNDDTGWIQFRCRYVEQFVKETRAALQAAKPNAVLTTVNYSLADRRRLFWDWQRLIGGNDIDIVYFRTEKTQDLVDEIPQMYHLVRKQNPALPLVGCLDLKNYSSFRTPEAVADGLRDILRLGFDRAGVYGLQFTPLAPNPKEAPLRIWTQAKRMLEKMGR